MIPVQSFGRGCFTLFTLGCLALVAGCSNDRLPTYPVRGRVVFSDGEPVKTGTVEFQSVEHALNARGQIARDGTFRLGTYSSTDGAVSGTHRVIVIQFLAMDSTPEIQHDHGDPVDLRYASYDSSDLEAEVVTGANELELVVERLTDEAALETNPPQNTVSTFLSRRWAC
jgi:hypothetical protein